jgi:transposase-like protein
MSKKIKKHHPDFKFKVALESFIKNNVAQTARKFNINANQLSNWRKEFQKSGALIFDKKLTNREKQMENKIESLENLIGKKEIEINVLKKYLDFYAPPNGS